MHASPVGQACVHVWRGVVKAPSDHGGEPLGKPSYRVIVLKPDLGQLQAVTSIHVDLIRAVDQHVGYTRLLEQRLKRPRSNAVAAQGFDRLDERLVSDD